MNQFTSSVNIYSFCTSVSRSSLYRLRRTQRSSTSVRPTDRYILIFLTICVCFLMYSQPSFPDLHMFHYLLKFLSRLILFSLLLILFRILNVKTFQFSMCKSSYVHLFCNFTNVILYLTRYPYFSYLCNLFVVGKSLVTTNTQFESLC